jgi:hypothetical protein
VEDRGMFIARLAAAVAASHRKVPHELLDVLLDDARPYVDDRMIVAAVA